ncbi:MAG: hypothetical protein QXL88_01030 [Candidatus Pacearchaeota archaeon]
MEEEYEKLGMNLRERVPKKEMEKLLKAAYEKMVDEYEGTGRFSIELDIEKLEKYAKKSNIQLKKKEK